MTSSSSQAVKLWAEIPLTLSFPGNISHLQCEPMKGTIPSSASGTKGGVKHPKQSSSGSKETMSRRATRVVSLDSEIARLNDELSGSPKDDILRLSYLRHQHSRGVNLYDDKEMLQKAVMKMLRLNNRKMLVQDIVRSSCPNDDGDLGLAAQRMEDILNNTDVWIGGCLKRHVSFGDEANSLRIGDLVQVKICKNGMIGNDSYASSSSSSSSMSSFGYQNAGWVRGVVLQVKGDIGFRRFIKVKPLAQSATASSTSAALRSPEKKLVDFSFPQRTVNSISAQWIAVESGLIRRDRENKNHRMNFGHLSIKERGQQKHMSHVQLNDTVGHVHVMTRLTVARTSAPAPSHQLTPSSYPSISSAKLSGTLVDLTDDIPLTPVPAHAVSQTAAPSLITSLGTTVTKKTGTTSKTAPTGTHLQQDAAFNVNLLTVCAHTQPVSGVKRKAKDAFAADSVTAMASEEARLAAALAASLSPMPMALRSANTASASTVEQTNGITRIVSHTEQLCASANMSLQDKHMKAMMDTSSISPSSPIELLAQQQLLEKQTNAHYSPNQAAIVSQEGVRTLSPSSMTAWEEQSRRQKYQRLQDTFPPGKRKALSHFGEAAETQQQRRSMMDPAVIATVSIGGNLQDCRSEDKDVLNVKKEGMNKALPSQPQTYRISSRGRVEANGRL